MKNIITIYVDDVRTPTNMKECIIVRSYRTAIEAIDTLSKMHFEIILDLDHDLGEYYSGYDICKFVVENQIPLHGYRIHSMNPVGRNNMNQLLSHYGYKTL